MRLCQFFCCGRKANLLQIFLLDPNFLLVNRNKLSVTVYLFLALYGSTTIQSQLFLKNIENFVWFPKQYLLGFFILEKQLAYILVSCFSITLFYCTLLALTHRQNHRQRNKYTRYAWAGGTFFPVVLLCQFFVLVGNRSWFYILLMYLEYHTVVVLCLFFWFWGEIVFGNTYVLSVQYSWLVVSVFLLWRES